jgi:hypothetical protein
MNPATELAGKHALVTGGTKGIGQAVVARLLAGGAEVMTTARRPSSTPLEARFVQADIATAEGCQDVIDEVAGKLGGVDIIVHVAGGSTAPSGG